VSDLSIMPVSRESPAKPAVLTVEEAGELLRIGRSAAYAAVRAGEIPSIKVGRSIRVPTFRLEQLLGLQNDNGAAGNGAEVRTFPPIPATGLDSGS
jgi:excisionase family DNA binding protein